MSPRTLKGSLSVRNLIPGMKCSHSGKPLHAINSTQLSTIASPAETGIGQGEMLQSERGIRPVVPLGADVGADPEVHVEPGVGGGLDEPHQVIPALEVVLSRCKLVTVRILQ